MGWKLRLLVLVCLCMLPLAAFGEATPTDVELLPPAEDITEECRLSGGDHMGLIHDKAYNTIWESNVNSGYASLTITAPEGKTLGGVMIHWWRFPLAVTIQAPDGQGGWQDVASVEGKYYAQYYPLDDLTQVRIIHRDAPTTQLKILEITVMSSGQLPEDFQLWEDPPEKVDLMLLHGHPDDEILWFGGLLPTYGGQEGKNVLVVCAATSMYARRHELLDCLWTCGIRIHPVFLPFTDIITSERNIVLKDWGKDKALSMVTELYRRYKPDVVVTQDMNGEYGHGVHRAISYVACESVALAADAAMYPEQVAEYGVWDVPKMYVHLYEENQIRMDWWQPLSAFGGRTAQDVAREAFLCHKTQQNRGWAVQDGGDMDNSLFGLYHTTVGPDVIGGDLFENLH